MNDNSPVPARVRPRSAILDGLDWRRVTLIRRWLAGLLVVVAAVLAARDRFGAPERDPVLVAARDLAPGSTLSSGDLQLSRWPPDLVPAGALTAVAQAEGRVLAGAANRGEPLTAPRLAGPELTRRAGAGSDAASVPIRLADGGVAGLLGPGRTVDVITLGERSDQPSVLAAGATVLAVLPAEQKAGVQGRLVLVAVPRSTAARLAAATLAREVTVTLR